MNKLREVASQIGALVVAALNTPGEWAVRQAAEADHAAGTIMLASGCTLEEAVADLNAARRQMLSRNWDDAVDWVLTEKREQLRRFLWHDPQGHTGCSHGGTVEDFRACLNANIAARRHLPWEVAHANGPCANCIPE